MKALSVKHPWCEFIMDKIKPIETRTWNTKHRGDLLIVSSMKPTWKYSGYALCVVNLADVRHMTIEDEPLARCEIYDRAKSWILSNIRLIEPFKVKGQLSLYEVDDRLIKYLPVGAEQ